jgi:hypothetical protein
MLLIGTMINQKLNSQDKFWILCDRREEEYCKKCEQKHKEESEEGN